MAEFRSMLEGAPSSPPPNITIPKEKSPKKGTLEDPDAYLIANIGKPTESKPIAKTEQDLLLEAQLARGKQMGAAVTPKIGILEAFSNYIHQLRQGLEKQT